MRPGFKKMSGPAVLAVGLSRAAPATGRLFALVGSRPVLQRDAPAPGAYSMLLNAQQEVAAAKYPQIRQFTVKKVRWGSELPFSLFTCF